jgi:hypothetical protein
MAAFCHTCSSSLAKLINGVRWELPRRAKRVGRYITARKGDTLVVGGHEVDVAVLEEIMKPDKRVLWAFVRNDAGDVTPICYSEDRVIWLTQEDVEIGTD